MGELRKRGTGAVAVALVLAALLALYVGAYYAMVVPMYVGMHDMKAFPIYVAGWDEALDFRLSRPYSRFFAPMHWMDRRIRPHVWK